MAEINRKLFFFGNVFQIPIKPEKIVDERFFKIFPSKKKVM